MAAPNRRKQLDLIQALAREPYRYQFFQAIRLLALAEGSSPLPRRLRFRTPGTLAFAPSEITGLAAGPEDLLEMEVSFLGLTGPAGVLPQHYTETLLERRHLHRDGSLHAFLDLFNHRACALFFAAWRKYRFHIAFEQGHRSGFTSHLKDLLTVRPPATSAIPGEILVHFGGALARRPLPACSLVALLGTYYQVEVRLESFVGQWACVPRGERTCLRGPGPLKAARLGEGAFLGERLWDPQTKVRLHLGPLDRARFRSFQPGRSGAESLRQFIQLNLGAFLACDLALAPREATPLCLVCGGEDAPQLGLNTWLRTRPATTPPDPVCFRLQA